MSDWPLVTVDALCSRITSGGTPSRRKPEYFANHGGHPWVKSAELLDAGVNHTEEMISDQGLENSSAKYLPEGTVLLAMYGANVGQLGFLKMRATLNQAICGMVTEPQRCDPQFLFYSLKAHRGRLIQQAHGAAQQNLSAKLIKLFSIPVPPLETQQRIAAILGAYDDLIEVNRRRVAVLEEMARGLFEEWFVRFRFPGHEDVAIVDTPDGPMPEGWEWGAAKSLVDFDPMTKVPKEGKKPFIPMGLLDTVTSLIEPFEYRSGNSGAKFLNHDTLFARITPCLENGKTGLVRDLPLDQERGFGSTEFIVIRSNRAGPAFAYCLARNASFRDHAQSSMSGASGRQRARTDSVADFQMGVPPDGELLQRFDETAWPMLELVGQLGRANHCLAASCDLLLPRLISGQLSVETAERQLENAA